MPIKSTYLLVASMDVEADKEALFNEVYDTEHVPALLKVPGVNSVVRGVKRELKMVIGGELRTITFDEEPKYTAVYELDSLEVLAGDGWAEAVERGRWPEQVRPYTKNRRHILYEIT